MESAESYCPACRYRLKPDSRYCSACGRPVAPGIRRVRFQPWMAAPAIFLAVLLVVLPGMLYVWAGLPSTSNLSTARLPLSTRIYDRTGTVLLAEIHQGSERRHIVPLSQVAPSMQHATVAVEDRTFYQHGGLNLLRTGQAGLNDLIHLRFNQGGSTITQQLVKNIYLSGNRSVLRKLDEAILAVEIEHQYSKSQILEAYLNRIYYGNQAYGVEAAAQTYFGKPARQLSLSEATLLAGLPQAPMARWSRSTPIPVACWRWSGQPAPTCQEASTTWPLFRASRALPSRFLPTPRRSSRAGSRWVHGSRTRRCGCGSRTAAPTHRATTTAAITAGSRSRWHSGTRSTSRPSRSRWEPASIGSSTSPVAWACKP